MRSTAIDHHEVMQDRYGNWTMFSGIYGLYPNIKGYWSDIMHDSPNIEIEIGRNFTTRAEAVQAARDRIDSEESKLQRQHLFRGCRVASSSSSRS
jgi:hypothetical protein